MIYQRITIYFNAKLSSRFHCLIYQRATIFAFSLVDNYINVLLSNSTLNKKTAFMALSACHTFMALSACYTFMALSACHTFMALSACHTFMALSACHTFMALSACHTFMALSACHTFMALSACHTRDIPIAVTCCNGLYATSRAEQCEQGEASLVKAHTGLDTYSRRRAAGFNRQVGCREVVMWSSHSLRALDYHSAWSVIVAEVVGWSALCFTVGFL